MNLSFLSSSIQESWRRRKLAWIAAGATLLLLAATAIGILLWNSSKEPWHPTGYAYSRSQAANGVELHALKTSPYNIELKAVETNIAGTNEYGINGGFFYNGDLLSLAMQNDRPAKDGEKEYGTGRFNVKYARGTLVWDGAARAYSIQVVQAATELHVSDRRQYWAQGGISMNLRRDDLWKAQIAAEHMPAPDDSRLRTGIVYNAAGNVWLVVTPTRCTAEQFRAAIRETIGSGTLVDGIFLDGDGSSQLRANEITLPGDSREVYQLITIRE